MSATIDYGNLMHQAMRGLIREVLTQVGEQGLPGNHHFYITFDTTHPDIELADWLRERYPSEMTIVLQHWFDNLNVTDKGFGVTLNFGDVPSDMFIAYDALITFVDPSVEFGLRFEKMHADDDEDDEDYEDEDDVDLTPHTDAQVVSLDSFRK